MTWNFIINVQLQLKGQLPSYTKAPKTRQIKFIYGYKCPDD